MVLQLLQIWPVVLASAFFLLDFDFEPSPSDEGLARALAEDVPAVAVSASSRGCFVMGRDGNAVRPEDAGGGMDDAGESAMSAMAECR